jgi:phosphoglycerol transferase
MSAIARRLLGSPRLLEVLFIVAAAVGGVVVAVWTFDLWSMHPRVPLSTGGDGNLVLAQVKNLDRNGWYYTASEIGAPFGQDLRDYPLAGDSLSLATLKLGGLFTDDVALLVNAFYLATYPLIAVTGYLGCRLIGLRRGVALVAGIAYTALPYHLLRGEGHLFLSNYAVVPLAVALVLRQAGPVPLLRRSAGAPWRGLLHRDAVVGTAIVVAAATTGLYYAVFTCLFMAVAGVLAALRRGRRGLVAPALAVVAIGVILGLQLLPTLLYQASHGSNRIAVRSVRDFDLYPLRPSVMLLPVGGHRAEIVRDWRDGLAEPTIASEGATEAMGALGSIGFVVCLGLLVARAAGGPTARWSRRVADAPLLAVLAVLVASYSGLSSLIGLTGFTQVRAWNRISVVIAFLCIATAAAGLGHLIRRRPRLAPWVLPLVAVLAVWDQTPVWSRPDYEGRSLHWVSDQAFVRQIESSLAQGSAVFQLPLATYPEIPPIGSMQDYEQFYGYLHSESLRWSYGGMKGRTGDWILRLDPMSPGFTDDLLVTGFSGLAVNLDGYDDRGAALDASLREQGLEPSFGSADGLLRFYDLRPRLDGLDDRVPAADADARRRTLFEQPEVRFEHGFGLPENFSGAPFRWAGSTATIRLQGPVPDIGPSVVRLRVATFAGGPSNFVVVVDGVPQQFVITGMSEVDVKVDLRGDPVTLHLTSDAPDDGAADARDLVFLVESLPTVLYSPEP